MTLNRILKSINDYEKEKIRTGDLRRVFRLHRKEFLNLKHDERLKLALDFYRKKKEGSTLFATYIFSLEIEKFKLENFKILDTCADQLSSWEMTDDFCLNVLQPILLKFPKQTLSIIKKWNNSKHIWKRRASVGVFVRKIGESGKFTDECIHLCDNLLSDPERLVKQGVGWALKDSMRGNKRKVIEYVKKLRKEGVSSTITLYALRDLKGKEKEDIIMKKLEFKNP